MVDTLLHNINLKPNGENHTENEILSVLLVPIAIYDVAYNNFQTLQQPDDLTNYQKNLWQRCHFSRGKFFKKLFKNISETDAVKFTEMFDELQVYLHNDIQILKNSFYTLFAALKIEKRQLISDMFLIYVLTDFSIEYFKQACGGKHYAELEKFKVTLKKLINSITARFGKTKEVIDVSKDLNVINSVNILINKIKKFKI